MGGWGLCSISLTTTTIAVHNCGGYAEDLFLNGGNCSPQLCWTAVWDLKDTDNLTLFRHRPGHENIWEGLCPYFSKPAFWRIPKEMKEFRQVIINTDCQFTGGHCEEKAINFQMGQLARRLSNPRIGETHLPKDWEGGAEYLKEVREETLTRHALYLLEHNKLSQLDSESLDRVERHATTTQSPKERVYWTSREIGPLGRIITGGNVERPNANFLMYYSKEKEWVTEDLSSGNEDAERHPDVISEGPMRKIHHRYNDTWLTGEPLEYEDWKVLNPEEGRNAYQDYIDDHGERENEFRIQKEIAEKEADEKRARQLRDQLFPHRRRGAVRRRGRKPRAAEHDS